LYCGYSSRSTGCWRSNRRLNKIFITGSSVLCTLHQHERCREEERTSMYHAYTYVNTDFRSENRKERNRMDYACIGGRIIIKCILRWVVNFQFLQNSKNLLTSWATTSFSRKTLIYKLGQTANRVFSPAALLYCLQNSLHCVLYSSNDTLGMSGRMIYRETLAVVFH
jgi:hypothetical protein